MPCFPQTLTGDLTTATANDASTIEANHDEMKSAVDHWSEETGMISSDVAEWSDAHRGRVDTLQNRVDTFITGLKEDVPTGM